LCHPAVAALAVMLARVCALRNAFVLRSAPATERELSALRTALDLIFAFGIALGVEFGAVLEFRVVLRVAFRVKLLCARPLTELLGVLRVAEDRVAALPCVERTMLPPRGLDRADE
jgi:hypothetical protein